MNTSGKTKLIFYWLNVLTCLRLPRIPRFLFSRRINSAFILSWLSKQHNNSLDTISNLSLESQVGVFFFFLLSLPEMTFQLSPLARLLSNTSQRSSTMLSLLLLKKTLFFFFSGYSPVERKSSHRHTKRGKKEKLGQVSSSLSFLNRSVWIAVTWNIFLSMKSTMPKGKKPKRYFEFLKSGNIEGMLLEKNPLKSSRRILKCIPIMII